MTTTTFDTLTFVKKLKSAGVDEKQAEIQAEVLNNALSDFQQKELATKQDIGLIRKDLKISIAETKVEIIKWVAGMLVAQAAVIAAIVKLL